MRKVISVAMGLLLFAIAPKMARGVEMTWEFSVQASATVQTSPARITLTWPQDQYMMPNSYTVYRKALADTDWGTGTTLPGTATSYVDTKVVVGTPYEYRIVKVTSQYTGYGYLYSGINVPLTDNRGKLLLVVDNTYAGSLANELAQLRQDLVGDGWNVIRIDVGRTDSVTSVKDRIKAQYLADPAQVKCVFLFGHVPVPYSGDIVPDGHTPNHQGAWPCDGYYGDMDGTWTDTTVTDTGADEPRNHNVPGDGKFDQSTFPAPIKLMVGRVDLANLPGELWYGGPVTLPSELVLLRNYLKKDHKFRTKQMDLPQRAIVGDFFGVRNGEAFAASGYRAFSAFVGANNITNVQTPGAWTPLLKTTPYLWAYGCGAGSLASVADLGNSDSYHNLTTSELYTNDIRAVFTLFFGSWLGDWDGKDDIMRCVLALPSCGLASAWSGRPHWFLHHMGLGEPIGYSARLTQNNGPNGLYQNQINTAAGQIHVALMGDPTLRLHNVAPPSGLFAISNRHSVNLIWTASTDPVLGYLVYRGNADGSFTRLTSSVIPRASYGDYSRVPAANYMVRAVSLQTSPSGSYYNPSAGIFLNSGTPSAPTLAGTSPPQNGGTNSQSTGTGVSLTSGSPSKAPAPAGFTGTVNTNVASGGTSTGGTTNGNLPTVSTNAIAGSSVVDYLGLQLPQVGDHGLHVLSPTLLELKLITTKQPDPAAVTQWNFADSSSKLTLPPIGAFQVTADGNPVTVLSLGFKRRPLYAPMSGYDLRIENSLYLQLAGPISDNQTIQVVNPDGTLWSTSVQFVSKVDPLRYSPAIHVNQEGYMPGYSKKGMVGYYTGSMGEMSIPASAGFKIVDANTGSQVYQGSLVQRVDIGYNYAPTPYQQVYEADFTSFTTPGQYQLVVPGLGASLPFLIHDGVAIDFARAYALGLYHQRCGTNTAMPYTRFTHDTCHAAPASVPASASDFPFTWTTVAGYANELNANNPPQVAPALTSPSAALFPFLNQGTVDVSGGHHDAGDYSKYTINSASLVAYLIFAVDSLPGVADLDNLGIPESGDGISDVMQEAKWEADFLAKMQDADGGFYFLVYPKNREYESNVTPDHGDPQVVWPKTTSVTAASVAALAQCASSPLFKKTYPDAAATYLAKAQLGWQFLMNAVNKYGKNGAYQKITHYGDNFADNDELAWAACQMFLATGDNSIHQLLLSWFDPADSATWRWGWWHMSECYGHAIRSYAFAVQTGRATANQLDANFLSKCQIQIGAAGDDMLNFSQNNAYGTSFPLNTKAVQSAGWYFSTDQAFDLAVAYQLNPKAQYMSAMLANMNYEGGCNPLNLSFVTGLGYKRQRDIVSQWALNDTRVLPPSGIPVGNIGANFGWLWDYAGELEALCFPSDNTTIAPYPFYDRWGDSWNVSSEMVVLNQARSIGTLAFLAAQSSYKTQPWQAPANAQITVPTATVPIGQTVTVSLQVPGLDLSTARVTWEARDQEPAFGSTFTFAPKNNGIQWVEAEAQMPDGRRIFAKASFNSDSPNIVWVDDSLPTGAVPGSDGGDSWNWVSSNPAPFSGTLEHQSANVAGWHQHYFANARATVCIGTGDVLYAYVYLDPTAMPSEIMLQWSDGTWNHRAYWGANNPGYGVDGTASRRYMGPLPPAGQWVQLKVPASQVNLEGSTISGMAFTLFDGSASWDTAGRMTSSAGAPASITLKSNNSVVSRVTGTPAIITFNRAGNLQSPLTVNYSLAGTAVNGRDFQLSPATTGSSSLSIPAGAASADLTVSPLVSSNFIGSLSIHVALQSDASYSIGNPGTVDVSLSGNTVPVSLRISTNGAILTWPSSSSKRYHVAYKNNLTDPIWTPLGQVTATGTTSSWVDSMPAAASPRFYLVAQTN